jgi:hypothetical protein
MEETTKGNMIRLTGLWEREKGILSGGLSPSARLVILPNKIKKNSGDPDFIAYLAAPSSSQEEKAKPAKKATEAEQQEFWWQK